MQPLLSPIPTRPLALRKSLPLAGLLLGCPRPLDADRHADPRAGGAVRAGDSVADGKVHGPAVGGELVL